MYSGIRNSSYRNSYDFVLSFWTLTLHNISVLLRYLYIHSYQAEINNTYILLRGKQDKDNNRWA